MTDWKELIAVDPDILVGKPIVEGTRISVELILDRLADGWSLEQIADAYPRVTHADVLAAIAFVADPIPLSALQHWAYCPRQCALIHQEQAFEDNVHTARGQAVHRLVDQPGYETQAGVRVERALPLWSEAYGLIGKADLVEIHPDGTLYPVEFKHGRKRGALHDDIQLAAQALCLEEMLGRPVPKGAIYHASSHRRREVRIGGPLRRLVAETTEAIRAMLASGQMPAPVNDARCRECSLHEICQPAVVAASPRHRRALAALFDPDGEA